MIIITKDGGLVEEILTDEPELVDKQVTIIDYDTEGVDLEELSKLHMAPGCCETVYIRTDRVDGVSPTFKDSIEKAVTT